MIRRPLALRVVLTASACALAFAAAPVEARRLDSSGNVHLVTVESYQYPPAAASLDVLVHHVQAPDGSVSQNSIPGTDDPFPDSEPVLDIDPVTDLPFVVWVRDQGDGADLYVSRFWKGVWSAPMPLFESGPDESSPRVSASTDWIHVQWAQDDGGRLEFYRAMFDRRDLSLAFGPERIRVEDATFVSGEGDGTGGGTAPDDLAFQAGFDPGDVGDRGRIFVWGIRDEPVPVGYIREFSPDGPEPPEDLQVRSMSGRPVVTYRSGETLFYSIEQESGWTETRRIALAEDFDAAAARREIERSLERGDAPR